MSTRRLPPKNEIVPAASTISSTEGGSARPAPSSRGRRGSDISAPSAPPCGRAPRPMRRNSRVRSLPSGVFPAPFHCTAIVCASSQIMLRPGRRGQSGRVLAIAQGAACSVVQPARCGSGVSKLRRAARNRTACPVRRGHPPAPALPARSLPAPTAMCRSPTPSTARFALLL